MLIHKVSNNAAVAGAMTHEREGIHTGEGSSRVFGLDLLRAYAIFCVVYGHGYALLWPFMPSSTYGLPLVDGVSVFFVLSGFLIGRILLRTWDAGELDVTAMMNFWMRRWFRTLPNYALVLCLVLLIWKIEQRQLPVNWPKYFIFLQNFNSVHPDFFPEAWSLAVEEWFYVLTPLILLVAGTLRLPRKASALTLILGVIIAVTLFRTYRAYSLGPVGVSEWDVLLKKQVVTRFDSLMYGVAGAYLSFNLPDWWRRYRVSTFVIGIALLLVEKVLTVGRQSSPYLLYLSLTVLPLGTLLILPLLSSWHIRGRGGLVRLVTHVSLTSYSLYLIHFTIVMHLVVPGIASVLATSGLGSLAAALVCYLAYWLLSLGGSYLLWRHFEVPMTSLRERFRFVALPRGGVLTGRTTHR